MKNTYIKIISSLLCLITVLSVCSCAKTYKEGIAADELANAIAAAIPTKDGYYTADADFVDFSIPGASALCEDYIVKIASSDTNKSEFGVFCAANSSDVDKLAELCQKYIDDAKKNLIGDYLPEEMPKIENAKVLVYGDYVIYTVLTDADRQAAITAILSKIEK